MTKPDEFSWHELLDRTWLVCDVFEVHVNGHRAAGADPELEKRIVAVSRALHDLYQEIGRVALTKEYEK